MTFLGIASDVLGLIILILGMIIFLFEIVGIIKYKYLLNRMHAAGMGDTLGIFMCLFGLILISGFTFTSAKFALVILFLWFASPTASHLISKLEASTNEEIRKHLEIKIDEEEIQE